MKNTIITTAVLALLAATCNAQLPPIAPGTTTWSTQGPTATNGNSSTEYRVITQEALQFYRTYNNRIIEGSRGQVTFDGFATEIFVRNIASHQGATAGRQNGIMLHGVNVEWNGQYERVSVNISRAWWTQLRDEVNQLVARRTAFQQAGNNTAVQMLQNHINVRVGTMRAIRPGS